MIVAMLFLLCGLSVILDYYVFWRYLRNKAPRYVSVTYISLAIVANLAMLALSFVYKYLIADFAFMHIIVWSIFCFILFFSTRLIFCLFSFIALGLSRVWRGRKFRGFTIAGGVLALSIVGVMVYGSTCGRRSLRVEQVEIQSDRLPAAFNGFRIALFADIHLGNWGSDTSVVSHMVDQINMLHPDMVVNGGDLINIVDEELSDDFLRILSRIKAPVYSILGNHDLGFYVFDTIVHNPDLIVDKLIAKQEGMGWHVMQNSNEWIYRGVDSIMAAGVTYPNNIAHNGYNSRRGGSDLAKATQGLKPTDYGVLLSHSPLLFDSIPEVSRIDLTLSGHVHAMQFKIDVFGWKFSPASWLYPMYSGLYHDRGRHLYINDGIGYVLYPLRVGTKPEITSITLRSTQKQSQSLQ